MEDWIIGVLLVLFLIIPPWLALSRRKELQKQVDAWPKLSQRTGLAYTPATMTQKWWDSSVYPPSVRGEYRGRFLSMAQISSNTDSSFPYQNATISLNVRNGAHFSLSIQAKKVLAYIHKTVEVRSGDTDFDRRFSAIGSPCEYVLGAADLIIRSDPRLLAWIMRSFPSIELKGENLFCSQNSELTNLDDQIALLNLLCDLAELAEKMGRDNGDHDEATKFQIPI